MDNWGRYGCLTPIEDQNLHFFLAKVNPQEIEINKYTTETKEQCACRFLRARDFDVGKAVALISESSVLLKQHKSDECVDLGPTACTGCDENVLKHFYPHSQQGFDRYGRLICYEHNGNANITAVKRITSSEGLLSYHLWTMEKVFDDLFSKSPKDPSGLHILSTLVVCDFDGFGFGHVKTDTFDHLKLLISIDNVCYPELLGKMVIINCPSFIVGLFNMIKGFLAPRTQKKIELLNSGPESMTRLAELISAENLPQMYGGLAPNPFKSKTMTEFVAVPRDGSFTKTIQIPPDMDIQVFI